MPAGKASEAQETLWYLSMQKISKNRSRPAYYLQIDIRSFFVSIDKQILFGLVKKKETNEAILWLLEKVIFNNPSKNPVFKGQMSLFDQIHPEKSLFGTQNKKGLAIGNYTSQFFANVYLNELDQFAKHELKCQYYIRYVDDMVLLSTDKSKLETWEKRFKYFYKKS